MRIGRVLLVMLSLSLAACGGGHGGTSGGSPGVVPSAPLVPSTRAATRTARVDSAVPRIEDRALATGRSIESTAPTPSNVTTADMPVPRPSTVPCSVTLFTGLRFADFSPKPFQLRAAGGLPGALGQGRPGGRLLRDRGPAVRPHREIVWIGGVNVYFGTTAEPSRTRRAAPGTSSAT